MFHQHFTNIVNDAWGNVVKHTASDNDLKDEVSLWVLFSRACSAVTYISNTTLVKSA